MEDNKKYELNDKDLDEVAGGMASGDLPPREEVYVGDSLRYCEKCGRETEHEEYSTRSQLHGVCKICGERRRIGGRVIFDINTA